DWDNPEPPLTGDWITWCQDVLGNSIGTNAAVIFDVAHRWTQADLAPYAGRTITQLRFVPSYANCVYTVKVWTGGSATNAGTLVSSQVVPTFVEDDWNLVVLNTPVPIPTTGDLYYGFEVNTQGGYPAGCDNGPQIDGKGNMMYFEGEWTTLSALASTLTYNWLIKAFAQSGAASKAVELLPIAEHQTSAVRSGSLAVEHTTPNRIDRAITGYKVYRDGTLISTIVDPAITAYSDMDLPNATYNYNVTATYTTGESVPATTQAVVNVQLAPVLFGTDFESYDNFATAFAPWTMVDVDQSPTYGITNVEFPGSAGAMAYIIFNPSATTPPITTLTPHSGAKMAASFAATTPPNNDWMVTPRITLGTGSALKFYAKSHTATYGLERFRVGVSTLASIIPQGFQYITGGDYVEAPTAWTEYVYDLSAYDNQTVYLGIRCVSNDAFVFYVDDFTVHSNGGSVDNDDPTTPVIQNALVGNYPNPFNPETTISYSVKSSTPVNISIYNLKGQLVKTLVNEVKDSGNHSVVWNGTDNSGRATSSGVYYYKMQAGKFSSTKKMILMK
ncbi:MAG TPA: choice-of-anchor J domain-containing protein, partial [Candidatus Cloacimonadota bacterium]|nr:choice-of-anchor J domain-containing protein [Candidatus Cloacimonadota bacterium]